MLYPPLRKYYIFNSCNNIFTLCCKKLEKIENILTQAAEDLESECQFVSHDTCKAKVLLSILR